eukprot:Gb_41173 [translate_table: standard]
MPRALEEKSAIKSINGGEGLASSVALILRLQHSNSLVSWHSFAIYGLELVFKKNSHDFVHEYIKKPEFAELMRRLGALGDGNGDGRFHLLTSFGTSFTKIVLL